MPHGVLIYATTVSISSSSTQNPHHLFHFLSKTDGFSINSGDRGIDEGVSCTTAPCSRIEGVARGGGNMCEQINIFISKYLIPSSE